MKKNVYSLVLSEEIVDAIDRLSYRNGTNRSAMINRILAEYVSYTTPSMHRAQIFGSIEAALTTDAVKHVKTSDTFFVLASSINFKYNPTVRYSVELHLKEDCLGVFKASMRTQNAALIALMADFCLLWHRLEEGTLGGISDTIEPARYSRAFVLRKNNTVSNILSAEEVGALIAEYIRAFDTAIKEYFRLIYSPSLAKRAVENVYAQYIHRTTQII